MYPRCAVQAVPPCPGSDPACSCVSTGSGSRDSDSEDDWPCLGSHAGREEEEEEEGCGGAAVQVDTEDEKAIEMFMNKNPPLRQTLADIIMEKITEKQTEVETMMSEVSGVPMPQLDPRVLEVYKGVKEVLIWASLATSLLVKLLVKPEMGILIPLCESGTCTLREAVIIGSILTKCSIPVLHCSAAMLKVAEMDYNGANSIFLRLMIDKKYALPFRVIDALVFHFLRFRSDKRELPVLWHQSLLTLAQRYKEDLSSEQKGALLELLKVHTHPSISAEVRRELVNSKCRDLETAEPAMALD
ncbi:UNVERIFIED_CONTAM: hypothetical protein FKN15_015320 [Acipenser sinensis]